MIQHARGLTWGRAGPQVQNPSRAVPARIDLGCPRSAFTMVELLVVMVVIGILTAASLGALSAAREVSRVEKTKSTIAKLDSIVMEKYESYLTRRVPIRTSGLAPQYATAIRLLALRDLMRMEMPDRFSDITGVPLTQPQTNWPTNLLYLNVRTQYWERTNNNGIPAPSLYQSYQARLNKVTETSDYESAECLYLIVTTGNPEARGLFSDSEVGDADGDGLFEFHDGWGNPIHFLRWAPAITFSDIQTTDSATDHDPFDPYQLEKASATVPLAGLRLIPLIYSAGPDGVYGVDHDADYAFHGSPYCYYSGSDLVENEAGGTLKANAPNKSVTGPATGNNDDSDHFDNIHNHRLEVK